MDAIVISRGQPADVIDLRHAVLRNGRDWQSAVFPGDDHPAARHFIARSDGKVIGCVTLHPSQWENEPAFQLRGMAVDPQYQRNGIGSRLLRALEASIIQDNATRLLWCNARVPAIAFYARHGWTVVSEEFDVPIVGPHVKMLRRV
jgi:GNAT superfamily N-acetyltransferase